MILRKTPLKVYSNLKRVKLQSILIISSTKLNVSPISLCVITSHFNYCICYSNINVDHNYEKDSVTYGILHHTYGTIPKLKGCVE